MKMRIKKLDLTLPTPAYQTAGAAGLDLYTRTTHKLHPGERFRYWCGIAIELPSEMAGLVVPRSGWAEKYGITLVNSPGVIDEDYRGEIGALLVNMGDSPKMIEHGNRVAQLLVAPIFQVELELAAELTPTQRGANGFGSTGYSG